jgi:catechol 2,3-dioxygenase-like lactoylglutathione lyase family enzyme
MLHHVSLGTNDLKRAKSFYVPMMEHLGLRFIKNSERVLAYGLTKIVSSLEHPIDGKPTLPGNGGHEAFHAGHRKRVDACHNAGPQNGGFEDGPPGSRAEYDPHYDAAFLRDPDGNKIEMVTFARN